MKAYRRNIRFAMRFQYGYYQFMDHFFGRKRSFNWHKRSRTNFYKKLHQQLKDSGIGKVYPVDRRTDLTYKEFVKEYVRKGMPVILDGQAKDWDCVKNWSLDYFKNTYGDDKIVMVNQEYMERDYLELTLKEVIENIEKGKPNYYRFYPLLERHPERIKDFDYKWLRKHRSLTTIFEAFQVFIGADQTLTPLHNANQSNLFVQAYGEKKWKMYPNYYASIIDADPARNVYRQAPYKKDEGPFDPFNPNYDSPYTLYQYIDSFEANLKPGDVLWNPPYFWHAVRNEGNAIGVGYRWISPFYSWKMAPLYMFLDAFVTNPPFWKAYRLYKKDTNLLHMAEYDKLKDYEAKQKLEKQLI